MKPKVCLTCVIQGNCSTSCEAGRLEWLKVNKFGKKATKELLSDHYIKLRMNDMQTGHSLDFFRWMFDNAPKKEIEWLKKELKRKSK